MRHRTSIETVVLETYTFSIHKIFPHQPALRGAHPAYLTHVIFPVPSYPELPMFSSPPQHSFCHAQSIPLLVQTLPPEFLPLLKHSPPLSLSFLIFTPFKSSHVWNAQALVQIPTEDKMMHCVMLRCRHKSRTAQWL